MVEKSLLSDQAILRMMDAGKIVIEPFTRGHLSTSSYDVTLGKNYYRETQPTDFDLYKHHVYNPFSEKDVERVWGTPKVAVRAGDWMQENGVTLENIDEDDEIIWIASGETILCHTVEFIGGRDTVTTMMKARSSLGRNFIEICKCAGWGDIGYTNRWTMEITNNSRFYSIPLVVGRRVAQIVFFDTEGIVDKSYVVKGKYQITQDMETLMDNWEPSGMLPRMFFDQTKE
eukprot:TRINITY_DN1087_c0_g1_i1.p1 TRINITY_DN1087_c0_g1~~TRINITY_DN1087_c0_g1_i1.p1  ORF type:complete len:230 (+),score=60.52 TRINITY_DN1087_c0_g1_i1:64-753(+)